MIKADYHTHSISSSDGNVHMREMAEAAFARGLEELCITDHYDCHRDIWMCDLDEVERQLSETRSEFAGRLRLPYGIEIGQGAQSPEAEARALRREGIDFIIGSLHNLEGEDDFCFLKYENEEMCRALLVRYFDELEEHIRICSFDVLGHLTYPLRYMAGNYGFTSVCFAPYLERIEAIYKYLIKSGRGIELNTSGLRQKINDTMPPMREFKLYKECGGEIVTVGSDAHFPADVGAGFGRAEEMLRECGFSYYCVYRSRKPVFIKL